MLTESSFAEFVGELGHLLSLPLSGSSGGTLLVEDLALDSLGILSVVLAAEELAQASPTEEMPLVFTMQDAYDYYVALLEGPERCADQPDTEPGGTH